MTVMWRFIKYAISVIVFSISICACVQSDYTKLVKAELAKGIRQDSVLLGIRFGDSRDEFYGKCFDLNSKHLVTQGESASVQYLFTDSLLHKEPTQIKLLFVPAFDDKSKLTNMDLKFSYLAWAPWNRHLQSDSLEVNVKKLLMNWYGGNEFVTAKVEDKDVPVKVDGNRRILVYVYDTQSIVVRVQDILHPKFQHSISAVENK
jgi:hypothetical protein